MALGTNPREAGRLSSPVGRSGQQAASRTFAADAAVRTDGPPSLPGPDTQSVTPLGTTLPTEPLSVVYHTASPSWLHPVGVALVTALVVFAIGGVVVHSYRSTEPTPVVTTNETGVAAQPPVQGPPLSEIVKPKPAVEEPKPAGVPATAQPVASAASTGEKAPPGNAGRAAHGGRAPSQDAAPRSGADEAPRPPQSTADYLPGTL